MTSISDPPYLSVVVTSRNDAHGGNPLGRFQAFVNALMAQCRRVSLPAELIVVEWNPPADRPPLCDELAWPAEPGPCAVRFIEVPAALHSTLEHADALPLFQMIAKNVGIRRARGQFVLSTNIDILLSDELIDFIAARKLAPGTLYRVDRYDVEAEVPIDAPLATMMQCCREHQIRRHTRWGTYSIAPNGEPATLAVDVAMPDAGIRFGDGWHVREGAGDRYGRWASSRAELLIDESIVSGRLNIDVDADPYYDGAAVSLQARDDAGSTLLPTTYMQGTQVVQIDVSKGSSHRLWLEASVPEEHRRSFPLFELRDGMVCHVRRIWWETVERVGDVRERVDYPYSPDGWAISDASDSQMSSGSDGTVVVTDPRQLSYAVEYKKMIAPADGLYRFWLGATVSEGAVVVNALSGDRMRWLGTATDILAGSGRHVHSLNIQLHKGDSFYIVVSNNHSEDGVRTSVVLHELVGDHASAELDVTSAGEAVAAPGAAVSQEVPVTRSGLHQASQSLWARVSPALLPLLRRAFPVGNRDRVVHEPIVDQRLKAEHEQLQARFSELQAREREAQAKYAVLAPLAPLAAVGEFLSTTRPRLVHANACGDFQLMARDDWFGLRGFPEFEIFSMNIDGLFGFIADASGVREEVFERPCCIYHIEHAVGSGWTPEGEVALRQRIAARGIDWLDNRVVLLLASYMTWLKHPMIFNDANWGFSEHELPETVIGGKS